MPVLPYKVKFTYLDHSLNMRITLAGYNLDVETLDLVKQLIDEHRRGAESVRISELLDRLVDEPFSPETISAAYARISRSEKSVRELRRDARASVSRARQSNERIVFGLGHASVAEHAVFNVDVTDASRLALEELESHRLVSYTESSQRYISMSGDFITPLEITAIGLSEEFKKHCDHLFAGYRSLSERLEALHADLPEKERQGRAREDARYLLPLACRGQVGMTLNARNAEWICQQSSQSNLAEVREMGKQLQAALRGLVPSLIKYTDPNPKWAESESYLHSVNVYQAVNDCSIKDDVCLIDYPANAERTAIAALLMRFAGGSFENAYATVDQLTLEQRGQILFDAHCYIDSHTPVRREMELGAFLFELTLSASAFAQLKRHRIATLISSRYAPDLGVTIPTAVKHAGAEDEFLSYTDASAEFHQRLLSNLPKGQTTASQYALTNAHRRRVLFQANARELTHFSRLREDQHAQWDIRQLAGKIIGLAREKAPGLMMFAAGKDNFELVREEIAKSRANGEEKA